jgi:DNA-binding transcriptional MocR family regulator
MRADQLKALRDVLGRLSGAQAKLLLAIIAFSNAEGLSWPSRRILAETLGWSRDYVWRVLRQLKAHGLVRAERRLVRGRARYVLVLQLDGPPAQPEARFGPNVRPPVAAEPVPLQPQPQPPALPQPPQVRQEPPGPPCPPPPPPEAGEEALEEWAAAHYEEFERWAIETEPSLDERLHPLPFQPAVRSAAPLPSFNDGLPQPVRLSRVVRHHERRP